MKEAAGYGDLFARLLFDQAKVQNPEGCVRALRSNSGAAVRGQSQSSV